MLATLHAATSFFLETSGVVYMMFSFMVPSKVHESCRTIPNNLRTSSRLISLMLTPSTLMLPEFSS
jgi:hypothetical protein